MEEIKMYRPKWLRKMAKRLLGFSDDLVIARREAKSGKPTFALGFDMGGRMFPEWILSDVPMYLIKESLRDALRAARVLGAAQWDIEELMRMGREIREARLTEFPELPF